MALNAYLKLKGQKQGDIKGSVTQKSREGSLEVIAYSHSIVSPRDPASGLPTGKRMHKPFTVKVPLDCASPLLYSALVNNENITTWDLQIFRPDAGNAREKEVFHITLTNANVASIDLQMLDNREAAYMKFHPTTNCAFTYQAIKWTCLDPQTVEALDDWEAPVV